MKWNERKEECPVEGAIASMVVIVAALVIAAIEIARFLR